jgi:uncharacterized protein (DUF58 family)
VLTRRGLVLVAVVAALILVAVPLSLAGQAFVAGNLIVLSLIGGDWLATRPGAIEVERPEASPFSIGRRNPVGLVVRNSGDRVCHIITAEAPPPAAHLEPLRRELTLGRGEELELEGVVIPERRGPLQFSAVEVRVLGPMGLAFRERSHPGTAREELTWPDVLQLREERLLPPGRRLGGLRNVRVEAVGREFESLREYVRGDEFRRISWKATARRGKPVVAMQQPERRQTLLLAIETGRLMHGAGGAGLGKLDRVVNASVMLAAVAREYDDAVGTVAFGDGVRASLPPSSRPGQVRRVLDTIAPLDPELVEPDWARGLAAVGGLSRRRALVVVFSDALYLETDTRLLARLARMARRHLVMFAAVRDAELSDLAEQPVVDGSSLYERGVATALLERRNDALAAAARRGVQVLDAAPQDLTRSIVARFRALRSEGVL